MKKLQVQYWLNDVVFDELHIIISQMYDALGKGLNDKTLVERTADFVDGMGYDCRISTVCMSPQEYRNTIKFIELLSNRYPNDMDVKNLAKYFIGEDKKTQYTKSDFLMDNPDANLKSKANELKNAYDLNRVGGFKQNKTE